MYSFHPILTHYLCLFAAALIRAAAVSSIDYADCSIESASECAGIVYAPATWGENNNAEAIYSTVQGAAISAACIFTASPTKITLGIASTYHPTDVPSCVSRKLALTATATANISVPAGPSSQSAPLVTTAPSTMASSTAALPPAPIHTANCTMVFQPARWPQTTDIPSMPTGLVFSMYNSYDRDLSPGPGADCSDAPHSCNFATGNYPKSDRFAAFDSELPYPFNWAIANVAGDTVFYWNYHNPAVASTDNSQGAWDLSALDWSRQQNFTWDCSAPRRVHQDCTATTSYAVDKQDGGDTLYDVAIAILDPEGENVGGTTLNLSQAADNNYKDHTNMQFFSFWTPLITSRVGWDLTDGGGHRAFYFAYGENDYQTDGTGTVDKATGVAATSTVFDCYYDDLDEPWLGP